MGNGRDVLGKKLNELEYKDPITIEGSALLNEANVLFKKTMVDTIVVTEKGKPVGMLDIQDLKL
jgi:transaldolase